MSVDSDAYCAYCAADEAKNTPSNLRQKYPVVAVSAIALIGGLVLEFASFPIHVYYAAYLVSMLSAGRWVIPAGLRGAAQAHLDINFLMTFAAIGAMLIGAPAEGASVMLLFSIAELLEEKSSERVRTEIESLLDLKPPSITVKTPAGEQCKSPEDVEVGDIITIRPGDKIGLDGQVVQGSSAVNQAPITGESMLVTKEVGDEVYAGTINGKGYLEIEVTKESGDTVLSKIIDYIEQARKEKAPAELTVTKFSHIYTPAVVGFSLGLTVITFLLGLSLPEAIYRGLSLLVISCPCAFAISIPVSMVSSITGSARDGVLVKASKYVERMSKVKTVAFDKTGTLTQAKLEVRDIHTIDANQDEVLEIAASLERMSEHPLAEAIVQESKDQELPLRTAYNFRSLPGRGIRAEIDGTVYLVGNRRLMEEKSISISEEGVGAVRTGTPVYVAKQSGHIGTLILADVLRPESKATIDALKEKGIRTVMLTGDHNSVAREIATELGIDEWRAELLPHEKVEAVKELGKEGPIIMVGDGVNDAPAMAAADAGISMGVISSDIALETSDIALMEDDLSRIPELLQRAKKTMGIVRNNVILSIGTKAVLGVLAIPGFVSLWIAIGLGDMGITLAVIANALRLAIRR
ncbi:MAG: cadmium-translocating P-type ATPase [Candidatus Thorarchaeota archaeon]|nr:cadmium-translocating P-type ATPase [Candidatus Thorarchaeota archaeon]